MTLAAERTYLAYLRTGLALTAAGVAVVGALPSAGVPALRRVVGVVLVLVGLGVTVSGRQRYRAVNRAMRAGEPLPRTPLLESAAWALAGVAALAVVLVLIV